MARAAVAVILWEGRVLLLQRREDDRAFPGGVFCLPGGNVDDLEDLHQGLLREISEETGLVIYERLENIGKRLAKSERNDREYSVETFRVSLAEKGGRPPTIRLSEEHQGFLWADPGENWVHGLPFAGPMTRLLLMRERFKSEGLTL
jgi:8-oxo-dGTP pyrophosphatase MutT (NUDIX family)